MVDSFCMAFFNSTANQFMRKLSLDSLFLFKLSGFSSFFPVVAPLMSDPRFPREVYTRLGAIGLTTMMWISTMDVAMKMQQKVFYFYIRKYAWASLYRNYIYIYMCVCVCVKSNRQRFSLCFHYVGYVRCHHTLRRACFEEVCTC